MAERARRALLPIAGALALVGCNTDGLVPDAAAPSDLSALADQAVAGPVDASPASEDGPAELYRVGPPFVLHGDPQPDPGERDSQVKRDQTGALVIDPLARPASDVLWIPDQADLSRDGSISKLDRRSIREVARYRTVTCYSNPGGSTDPCRANHGCCSRDDWSRYQARMAKVTPPDHQEVQRGANGPARVGLDWNGDAFVANAAPVHGQPSVTKIAGAAARCLDRNGNGRIDTSSDSNGDGFIQTDCNGDGQPDNLAGVQARPCTNGLAPEFYGEDDECVLWTSDTFPLGGSSTLVLATDGAWSTSVWTGASGFGMQVRLDGDSGVLQGEVRMPNECYGDSDNPFDAVIDSQGVLWSTPTFSGSLCYVDTANPKNAGAIRDPAWGKASGYGLALDRDQNLWLGGAVQRYAPDRSQGTSALGKGSWTRVGGWTGFGIAADDRSADEFFVWSCRGSQVRGVPASALQVLPMDYVAQVDGGWPVIDVPCYGVGVDGAQDVWAVPEGGFTTRLLVDATGRVTPPVVGGKPMGNDVCPAGDSCPNAGAEALGDFTGFALRHFGPTVGSYGVVLRSRCLDTSGTTSTAWGTIDWQADLPPGTSITVRYRLGSTPTPDASWSALSTGQRASPIDLGGAGPGGYLEVQVGFTSPDRAVTPRLLGMTVTAECFRG